MTGREDSSDEEAAAESEVVSFFYISISCLNCLSCNASHAILTTTRTEVQLIDIVQCFTYLTLHSYFFVFILIGGTGATADVGAPQDHAGVCLLSILSAVWYLLRVAMHDPV